MDAIAAEKLKEITQTLIQARQAQGMSLEEIATKTYIPLRILKAMEEGETYKLPEPVFVQGFIKRYANLVGLDGVAIAQAFPTQSFPISGSPVQSLATSALGLSAASQSADPFSADARQVITAEASHSRTSPSTPPKKFFAPAAAPSAGAAPRNDRSNSRWVWPLAIGMGTLLVGSLVWAGINRPTATVTSSGSGSVTGQSSGASKDPSPKANSPSSASLPAPAPAPSKPPTAPAATNTAPSPAAAKNPGTKPSPQPSPSSQPKATGPVTVSLDITEESWVEVEVDGQVMTSEILKKGTKKTVSGKNVVVSTGNARGVSVSYNQQAAKAMGATADLAVVKFPPTSNP
ncbi:MAG: helix-turn-helix domain-containing protein [Synechococcales bacterium]|nr:helix-turn-helix domain-containing protein [Synechococcales bacterium]